MLIVEKGVVWVTQDDLGKMPWWDQSNGDDASPPLHAVINGTLFRRKMADGRTMVGMITDAYGNGALGELVWLDAKMYGVPLGAVKPKVDAPSQRTILAMAAADEEFQAIKAKHEAAVSVTPFVGKDGGLDPAYYRASADKHREAATKDLLSRLERIGHQLPEG
jgi:hypothetical protein